MLSFKTLPARVGAVVSRFEPALLQFEKTLQVRGPLLRVYHDVVLPALPLLKSRMRVNRIGYRVVVALVTLFVLHLFTSASSTNKTTTNTKSVINTYVPLVLPLPPPPPFLSAVHHLPHIPPNIWQLLLDFSENQSQSWHSSKLEPYRNYVYSWIANAPSYSYALLDSVAADQIIYTLSSLDSSTSPDHPIPFAKYNTTYNLLTRGVMRADFLRYLILALRGGIYSDSDTMLLRPITEWVPDEYKNKTKLIVGIEGDAYPPLAGMWYPVQFCQWTVAAAPGHPVLWGVVEHVVRMIEEREEQWRVWQPPPRIVKTQDEEENGDAGDAIDLRAGRNADPDEDTTADAEDAEAETNEDPKARAYADTNAGNDVGSSENMSKDTNADSYSQSPNGADQVDVMPYIETFRSKAKVAFNSTPPYTNDEVLTITGPAAFTSVVMEYLSLTLCETFTWRNLSGMMEPTLYGDILVLPINGFATGLPHSGSNPQGSPDAFVRHFFSNGWKGENDT